MTVRFRMQGSRMVRLMVRRVGDLPISAWVFHETTLRPSDCGLTNHGDHRVLKPLRCRHRICEGSSELGVFLEGEAHGGGNPAARAAAARPRASQP